MLRAGEMEEEKKVMYRDRHRNDQCLLMVAVCLSTVSILITIACGISVVSMREKNLDYETRLRRLEDQCRSGHQNALKTPEGRVKAILQDSTLMEKVKEIGNVLSIYLYLISNSIKNGSFLAKTVFQGTLHQNTRIFYKKFLYRKVVFDYSKSEESSVMDF